MHMNIEPIHANTVKYFMDRLWLNMILNERIFKVFKKYILLKIFIKLFENDRDVVRMMMKQTCNQSYLFTWKQ